MKNYVRTGLEFYAPIDPADGLRPGMQPGRPSLPPWRWRQKAAWLLLGCTAALGIIRPVSCAAGESVMTSVWAKASDDYVRPKRPDGSFEPKTYAFAEGGAWSGSQNDASIDKLRFLDVAQTIAGPLATQQYLPAKDPQKADLLIMVYWGTTTGARDFNATVLDPSLQADMAAPFFDPGVPEVGPILPPPVDPNAPPSYDIDPSKRSRSFSPNALLLIGMANRLRNRTNQKNAGILGYTDEMRKALGLEFTAAHAFAQGLMDELEENRYFVTLLAYDFQLLWKQKKPKLLWETRYSIREHGNDFSKQLGPMTLFASRYFGHDSKGLLRNPLPVRIDLGDLKVIEIVPGK